MTNKFKVGDKVRITSNKHSFLPRVGTEDVIDRLIGHSDLYCLRKFTSVPVCGHEMELVPKPRLFRKGDKVTVVYEVMEDQKPHPANTVKVRSTGFDAPVSRSVKQLQYGTLDPAPEPPFVPKPGDKFRWVIHNGEKGCLTFKCLAVDPRFYVYENSTGHLSVREWVQSPAFERVA